MTEPVTSAAAAAEPPAWEDQAIDAYKHEQTARQRRHIECVTPDILALKDKLTELGITPLDGPYNRPYQVADDGTVTALIARPDSNSDDPAEAWRRMVFACARAGRMWLRATEPDDTIATDVAGELHSLADVGRALFEGPQPLPAPATNYDQAERHLHTSRPDCTPDTSAICQALDGLTHAVLAVADELRDADLTATSGSIERHTGGAR